MIQLLYGLFLLGVLALVVGCLVYLTVTPDPNRAGRTSGEESPRASKAAAKKAEELSGSYRLSELESLLQQLGAIEAWGMVLELEFTTVQEAIQMIVTRDNVELCAPSLESADTDLFRRAAKEAGFEARPGYIEGQFCVDVTGNWSKIAGTIAGMSRSIYGVGDSEEVQVRIFG